jgi:hypothetical protein
MGGKVGLILWGHVCGEVRAEQWLSREDWEDCKEGMFRVLSWWGVRKFGGGFIDFQDLLGVVHFFFGYPWVIGRGITLPWHEEATFSFYISHMGKNGEGWGLATEMKRQKGVMGETLQ